MPFVIFALAIATIVGGSISMAAQRALPGDALWSFRIGVNENIEAVLAPGGTVRADFDIVTIEERMKEADALAASGRLTADVKAELEANLTMHVKSVQDQITKLEARSNYLGAAGTAARLQAALGKQTSGALNIRAALDAASNLSADASTKAAAY